MLSIKLMRGTALLVLVTFLSLVTSPLQAAVHEKSWPHLGKNARHIGYGKALHSLRSELDRHMKARKHGRSVDEGKFIRSLENSAAKLGTLDARADAAFQATEQEIKARHLPAVILDRQKAFVKRFNERRAEFRAKLKAIRIANQQGNTAARAAAVADLAAFMDKHRTQRPHQSYDPRNLNPVFKPNPDNKPRLTHEQFLKTSLYSNPLPKLAALGDFKIDGLPSAADPAYLAATPEVTLTQAIKDQAATLNHNPVKIYDWVRNNVEWLPTWGAFQSADMTLSTRRGNAMDIASLTIALLRASGIPARYVYGTIDVPAAKFTNWVGDFADVTAAQQYASAGGIPTSAVLSAGKIKSIRMEHVWVEAAIDYVPSRGAVNLDADSWVPMDPSFKQYTYQQGLDVATITGLDSKSLTDNLASSGTVNDSEGWIQGLDSTVISNAQQQAQQKLQDYIANNMTNPTVGDVIGGRRTIVHDYQGLPGVLSNSVVVTGARYAELPDGLRNFMSFAFGKDALGEPNNPIRFPWAEVNNAKITLSFRPATAADEQTLESFLPSGEITDLSQLPSSIPAYLINVVPELKLNGKVVKTGTAMNLGDTLDFVYQVKTPLETRAPYTYSVISGSYLSIATVGSGVAPTYLTTVKDRLTATQTTLQSQNQTQIASLTREDVLGDMFYSGVLGYFAEYTAISHIMALQQRAGQSLAIGYGSYGYEPSVTYYFGIPRSIEAGGGVMNIRLGNFVATHSNDHVEAIKLNEQLGLLSSALESALPEQMFSTTANPSEAASAVTAIAMAEQQGQKIYHITPANQTTTLSNIHLSQPVIDEIKTSLAAGKEVITHTNNVSISGWTGAGYIIIDPNTGIGAYKISGGLNGGFSSLPQYAADALVYLSNGDGLSAPFRFLSNFTGSAFGAVGDFVQILNMDGCGVGDAIGGALLNFWIASYLTDLSFTIAAAILNPLLLILAVFLIIYAINVVTSLIKSGIEYACRAQNP